MIERYFYAWTPPVLIGAVVLLSLPWLGLIALVIFALAVVAVLVALVWAIVAAPIAVGHAIGRRWRERGRVAHPLAGLSQPEREISYVSIGEPRPRRIR
jgi:hypothetical protein